ncbi:hypothetical protein DdX_19896 [Ditylenchus destructor]|uniref:Uncharacterized protein n=1 Tax=Ditylenchus destructor TaxID=166010 RepID=A0AAD4MMF2_9BILA|nr:hypothetical protein DdX_19896 [Ditylenchus destructor]
MPLILVPQLIVGGFPASAAVAAGRDRDAAALGAVHPVRRNPGRVRLCAALAGRSGSGGPSRHHRLLPVEPGGGGIGLWTVHAGWGAKGLVAASASGMVAAALLNGGRLWWVTRRLRLKS